MSRGAADKSSGDAGPGAHSDLIANQGLNAIQPEVQPRSPWLSFAVCLSLAVAVWAVFGQSLHHQFVNFDDDVYVYDNPAISRGLSLRVVVWDFTHRHAENWHPLTSWSHMLDCQVYGLNPGGHHLTNVLLHAAAAILLFLLLREMTGAFWRSAFVAAVFAIHPLRVESVAWVSERKDVLSGLFFMLTLRAYVRYVRKQEATSWQHEDGGSFRFVRSPYYWLTLLLFALGLMSKPMLVTLPFVLLLLDYWPLQRFTIHNSRLTIARVVLEKIPFLPLTVAACVATILAQERAALSVQGLTLPWRIGNAVVAYADYIAQMIYPVRLAVFYPHPGPQLPVWKIVASSLLLFIISAAVTFGRKRRPYLPVGWLWYLGMLVPVIGLMQVGIQARADRYTYLPQIGLYIILAWGAVDFFGAWRYRRVVLGAGAAVILASLLVAAKIQTRNWKNSLSLWSHALACTSENFLAQNNLGDALEHAGKLNEAIGHYELAVELKPDYAGAHNNLGNALMSQGRQSQAIQHLEQALLINPNYPEAHNNMGNALTNQGKLNEAVQHYERAIQLKPDLAASYNNLGNVLTRQGKLTEAVQHCERALQLKPDYAEAEYNLGIALGAQWQLPQAVQHLQLALNLAKAQRNTALAETIRAQIGFYQSALPQAPATSPPAP